MAVDTKDLGEFPIIDWPAPEFTIEDHTPTLRDQFAMAALTGLCVQDRYFSNTAKSIGVDAYRIADAMIQARDAK